MYLAELYSFRMYSAVPMYMVTRLIFYILNYS